MQTIYCRHLDCLVGYASVAGDLPRICPACNRVSQWSTVPPWKLSKQDEKFLLSLRINPIPIEEEDDGA